MGWDIRGWLEIRSRMDPDHWRAAADLSVLLARNYDAFGCLFGHQNYANFIPVAAGRRCPKDASERVRKDLYEDGDSAKSVSWVSRRDLSAVDWDERALHPDSRLRKYERQADGSLTFISKSSMSQDHFRDSEFRALQLRVNNPDDSTFFSEGVAREFGNTVYRAETMTRRDAMGSDWWMLFEIMKLLAEKHGDDGVRLIVWFVF